MEAPPQSLFSVTRSQVKPASEVFARAFHNYPLFKYFIPDDYERNSNSHYIFEAILRYGVLYGEVNATSADLEGVSIWLPSDKVEMTVWRMMRGMGFFLLTKYRKLGRTVFSRMMHAQEEMSKIHKKYAPFHHWYLWLLAVDPSQQGRGHAGKLLAPMLARLDQEHLPCYLETHDGENVPIYQHYGFKVVEETQISGTEITVWGMLRNRPLRRA